MGSGVSQARGPSVPTSLLEEYSASRPRSALLAERAMQIFPGGETRSVTHYAPFPAVIERGSGARLVDVDGNTYLDLVNNYTSLVHGNAFGPIRDAVIPILRTGTVFPSVTEHQLRLGEAIRSRIDSVELLRFTNSGSEASLLAARIARRHTERREIVVAQGGYHGGFPPFTPGEPEVRRIEYNNADSVAQAVTDRTAAVFVEPFLGAGGVVLGDPEFLRALEHRAREVGALFVLDEVQSFRNSFHGMQHELGLQPDLTILGKIIGGGFAIGALGGRAELLATTSALCCGEVSHAGTFNGQSAAAAAGLVSLDFLNRTEITRLNINAAWLAARLEAAASSAGIPIAVTVAGSILSIHPGAGAGCPSAAPGPGAFRAALHLALLLEGVYATPRGMINLSTVLEERDLDSIVVGYSRAFERIASSADELLCSS